MKLLIISVTKHVQYKAKGIGSHLNRSHWQSYIAYLTGSIPRNGISLWVNVILIKIPITHICYFTDEARDRNI